MTTEPPSFEPRVRCLSLGLSSRRDSDLECKWSETKQNKNGTKEIKKLEN